VSGDASANVTTKLFYQPELWNQTFPWGSSNKNLLLVRRSWLLLLPILPRSWPRHIVFRISGFGLFFALFVSGLDETTWCDL